MARFTKSNRVAARDMAVIDARRPGAALRFDFSVSRGDVERTLAHPASD